MVARLTDSLRLLLDYADRTWGRPRGDRPGIAQEAPGGLRWRRSDRSDVPGCGEAQAASRGRYSVRDRYSAAALSAISYWDVPAGLEARVSVELYKVGGASDRPIVGAVEVVIRPESGPREVACALDRAAHALLRLDAPAEGTELADRLDRAGREFGRRLRVDPGA